MNSPKDDDEDLVTPDTPEQDDSADSAETDAAPVNPAVVDYLSKLKAAQSTANDNQLLAGLARAGGTMSSAVARSAAPNQSAYDALDKSAQAPVNQVEAAQATALKQNQLQSSADDLQTSEEENDPDSDQSKTFRKTLSQFPSLKAAYGDDFDNITAADKDTIFDLIKTKETIDARKQEKQLAYAGKISAGQKTEMNSTGAMLESARGSPAVAQAEKDIYAMQKADSLANLYKGDPDKMPGPMLNLYVTEIAKAASGGVPTQHELDKLNSGTVEGSLATLWSKISNKPEPANAADFINEYQKYTRALAGDAQKVIQDRYGRILEPRKDDLGDANYNKLKTQYLDRFKSSSAADPAVSQPSVSTPGQTKPKTVTQNGHTYTLNPATGQYE